MAAQQLSVELNGWKKTPRCSFLIKSKDGKLYCSYDYDLLREEIGSSTTGAVFDDIGLNQSYDEALSMGNITKECSPKECPSFMRRLLC
jgi:hypothetical protein